MLSKNRISKILNVASYLAITGVVLGSAFTTASWGMDQDSSMTDSKSAYTPRGLSDLCKKTTVIKIDMILSEAQEEPYDIPFEQIFSANPFLKELYLLNVNLGDDSIGQSRMKALTSALSDKIEVLSLENCKVSNDGLKHLGTYFGRNKFFLKEVYLDKNQINDSSIPLMIENMSAAAKRGPETLQKVSLRENKIRTEGALHLLKSLEVRKGGSPKLKLQLTHVDLSGNSDINQNTIDPSILEAIQAKNIVVKF